MVKKKDEEEDFELDEDLELEEGLDELEDSEDFEESVEEGEEGAEEEGTEEETTEEEGTEEEGTEEEGEEEEGEEEAGEEEGAEEEGVEEGEEELPGEEARFPGEKIAPQKSKRAGGGAKVSRLIIGEKQTVVPLAFKPLVRGLEKFGKVVHKSSITAVLLESKDGANFVSIVPQLSTAETTNLWLNQSVKGDAVFAPSKKSLQKMCTFWEKPRRAVRVIVTKDTIEEALAIVAEYATWFKANAMSTAKKKEETKPETGKKGPVVSKPAPAGAGGKVITKKKAPPPPPVAAKKTVASKPGTAGKVLVKKKLTK